MSDFDIDKLLKQISELEAELKTAKKYGLVWDKEIEKEDVVIQCESNIPVFTPLTEKKILQGSTNNILIEGDNFHSLAALNFVVKDTVDVIYIDPPYNTGNEDFVYNDKFVNYEDGYRHSKWLNQISKRLSLSRELLKKNGLIFISIDDNEQANLKLLCDSIFGERNFVSCFFWMKTATASNLSKTVRSKMEYVLCYKKGEIDYVMNGGLTDGGDIPLLNGANKNAQIHFDKESVVFKLKDGLYKAGQYEKAFLHDDIVVKKGKADKNFSLTAQFKWSQETLNEEVRNGTFFIIKSDKFSIRFQRREKSVKTPSNLISKDECGVGTNEEGFSTLMDIFGSVPFNYSKPVSLIKYLINMNPNKDAVVCDFYAGSGTTGQAVLELNKEDGGQRRFILCTNNENNICEDITYPRLRTVITGKRIDGSKYSDGLPANLYYFKTDFIKDEANTEQAKYNLVEKVDSLLCIVENVFNEIERNNYSSHFSCEGKHLFIYNDYYNAQKFKEFKNRVLAAQGEKIVYVYSSDNNVDENLIDNVDVVIKPIPSKIYEIYKEIVEEIKRGE